MSFTGIPITSAHVIRNYNTTVNTGTGTATIPLDDTQPTITEGTEFLSVSMTPSKVTNQFFVDVMFPCSSNTADRTIIVALFQDSSCRAVAAHHVATADRFKTIPLHASFSVGETLATQTFSVRAGLNAAGTVQVGSNGTVGFDGAASAYIRVSEIEVI